MERLTEKRDNQNVIPLRQDGNEKWALASAGMGDAPTQFLYGSHADLLASYEDTNLTPEQILEIDRAYREKCEELAKYKQLEEDGLLLRLPCAIGSTIYKSKYPTRVDEDGTEWEICDKKRATVEPLNFALCHLNSIGRLYFLTREEAEQALKRLESET